MGWSQGELVLKNTTYVFKALGDSLDMRREDIEELSFREIMCSEIPGQRLIILQEAMTHRCVFPSPVETCFNGLNFC